MSIYTNVRTLAIAKGHSIASMERDIEMANGTIGKWKTASPNVHSIKKVADYLGVTVDMLLREDLELK